MSTHRRGVRPSQWPVRDLLGPETGEQLSLSSPERERRRRISEAVRQTRSAAGADAVLQVLEVDPEARVPERREVVMPFPEEL